MIIAGEASGDRHGAMLVQALRKKHPEFFFCGIGDRALEAAGVKILMRASQLSVVGIAEVLTKLPHILKGLRIAKRLLKSLRPDLLILIDFPDFNLKVAATAKKLQIPILYYISPQIWAWRRGRVKKIRKRVDHMAVILPFEAEFYKRHHVPVTYVGHPLLDIRDQQGSREHRPVNATRTHIGLLPGSRDREIRRHTPVMLQAAGMLQEQFRNISFTLSAAPTVQRHDLEEMVQRAGIALDIKISARPIAQLLPQCQAAVVASGTATLEAALAGTPMVVMYKLSMTSYRIGRLIRWGVRFISLVNLIAEKELVTELIQHEASAEQISAILSEMLTDTGRRKRLSEDLLQIKGRLGGGGASERVAEIAIGMLESN